MWENVRNNENLNGEYQFFSYQREWNLKLVNK